MKFWINYLYVIKRKSLPIVPNILYEEWLIISIYCYELNCSFILAFSFIIFLERNIFLASLFIHLLKVSLTYLIQMYFANLRYYFLKREPWVMIDMLKEDREDAKVVTCQLKEIEWYDEMFVILCREIKALCLQVSFFHEVMYLIFLSV